MKNLRLLSLGSILLLFALLFPCRVFASIIFSDDFSAGKGNWTSTAGPDLWTVKDGEYGALLSSGGLIIESVAGDIPISDYVEEFDLHPISGLDKNIDFRWINNSNHYEIHFFNPSGGNQFGKVGPTQTGWPKLTNFYPQNGQIYHFKIVLAGQRIIVYVDNNLLFDEVDPDYQFTSDEQVGIRISSGSAPPSEVRFDNVVIRDIEPGDIPPTDLDVPSLKQTSAPWQSQEYDTASIWSPLNNTINSWGCALTSATMVLKYYGINKLPNNLDLTPGTLNDWLKSEPDGYVRTGWINWLAISRLSKQATAVNGITAFDALEYRRDNSADVTQLTTDLNNFQPDILEEPGHFIVAKGANGSTFDINDPFYNYNTLFDGYGNTFLSLGRYIPSHTDLSYILLAVDGTAQISLKDSGGNDVGEQYLQNPISTPGGSGTENGSAVRFVYLPVAPDGTYNILVSGLVNQHYNFDAYLYNSDGIAKIIRKEGYIGPGSQDQFSLSFDKENLDSSSEFKLVTFESTRSDINEAIASGDIKSAGPLLSSLKNAENNIGNQVMFQKEIDLFKKHLDTQLGKGVSETAYQILLYDINYLSNII